MDHPLGDHSPNPYGGLDLLSSAVVVLDRDFRIRFLNPAAENLFGISGRRLLGRTLNELVGEANALTDALENTLVNNWSYTGHNITLQREGGESLQLDCTVSPGENADARLLLEFRPIDQQLRVMREEQLLSQQQATKELIRNLAHEIKNPLGGIRGSAQLLEHELDDPPLREYTRVIIDEADRLQALMERLLSSHRAMQPEPLNIHEVIERTERLLRAEYPLLNIRRDFDTSLPDITGDREQLIQAVLNIARNAAQATQGRGEIIFRTRARRQVTIAKRRHRLALELRIIDNGPGVPEAMRDQIFFPLVSGRPDGTGLGLTLAQGFVQKHHGLIELETRPGYTCFTVVLPFQTGVT